MPADREGARPPLEWIAHPSSRDEWPPRLDSSLHRDNVTPLSGGAAMAIVRTKPGKRVDMDKISVQYARVLVVDDYSNAHITLELLNGRVKLSGENLIFTN